MEGMGKNSIGCNPHTSNDLETDPTMGAPFDIITPKDTAEVHSFMNEHGVLDTFSQLVELVSGESSSTGDQSFLSDLDRTGYSTNADTSIAGCGGPIISPFEHCHQSGEDVQNTLSTDQQIYPNDLMELNLSSTVEDLSMAICRRMPSNNPDVDDQATSFLLDNTPSGVKIRVEQFFEMFALDDVFNLKHLDSNDEWNPHTVQIVTALMPFVLPTCDQGPKRKRGSNDDVTSRPSKKRDKKSIEWWRRWSKLTREDIALDSEQVTVVNMGLGVLRDTGALGMRNKGTTFMDVYAAHVGNMLATERVTALTSVQYVVYAIFFHIASTMDPANWVAKGNAGQVRGKFCPSAVRRLFSHCGGYVPGGMTPAVFEEKLRGWQDHGRKYEFIGVHLGLGSIVHLGSVLHHTQLKTMTKGGEQAVDGIKSSEVAFRHLRKLGLPELAKQSGADALMHDLLWEIFGSFLDFPKRVGDSQFPAFVEHAPAQLSASIISDSGSDDGQCD
ncbi:hypothetical protein J4E93_010570 [Alternaria ventricosa]|uniref:uncharacterized protein n=1 Tax=Alternaria ventricosa TaxID=1187951 RepID=UPI0020C40BFF|nr:uncharacterized protein J4E93_010570 [Alternaria ventricosa]KAI4637170.1 hypothetical protein J4E93_010570 [Alternaria ventricosa]